GGDEARDAERLVLAVAIDRHQHVVAVSLGVVEGRLESRAVAAVLLVPDEMDVLERIEHFGRAVGRAVVDEQDVRTVLTNLFDHALDVASFVVDRQGGEKASHRAALGQASEAASEAWPPREQACASQARLPSVVSQQIAGLERLKLRQEQLILGGPKV